MRVLVALAVWMDDAVTTVADGGEVEETAVVVEAVVVVVVDLVARSVREVEAAVEMEPRVSLPCVA